MARVNTLVFFPSQTSRTQASSFLSHSETPTPGCKKAFHRSEILRDPSRHLFNLSRALCLTISTFLNPILTSAPQASRSSHPAQSITGNTPSPRKDLDHSSLSLLSWTSCTESKLSVCRKLTKELSCVFPGSWQLIHHGSQKGTSQMVAGFS